MLHVYVFLSTFRSSRQQQGHDDIVQDLQWSKKIVFSLFERCKPATRFWNKKKTLRVLRSFFRKKIIGTTDHEDSIFGCIFLNKDVQLKLMLNKNTLTLRIWHCVYHWEIHTQREKVVWHLLGRKIYLYIATFAIVNPIVPHQLSIIEVTMEYGK